MTSIDPSLALLGLIAEAPRDSLAAARAYPVDADRYAPAERRAAAMPAQYAHDFNSLQRNTSDALSFVDATGWPGFQTLALLAQLSEYRAMHEALADECVRKWGKVTFTDDVAPDAAGEVIQQLTAELLRLDVRSIVRTAVLHDQAYGGAHVLPRLTLNGRPAPADAPLRLDPKLMRRGSLAALCTVEPIWVTPLVYNTTDPTAADFYRPTEWMMLNERVHDSRMYTLVSRPVSDMLKAAYSFRGVSLTQMAMPYVDNWLRTRQSVSDSVKQFSLTYLKTDLSVLLAPGAEAQMIRRVQFLNAMRDNRNLALCDADSESFEQVNTPLSGLAELQQQSQDQMAAVSHTPLVKLTGITPSGLNANSDGEIRVWYDRVAAYQQDNLTPLLTWLLSLAQLSLFGKIDPAIAWEWLPLRELDEKEGADVRARSAEADSVYLADGVVTATEIRGRLNSDPKSGFFGKLEGDAPEVDDLEADALGDPATTADE